MTVIAAAPLAAGRERDFLLAGKAVFTLVTPTGRWTYKVRRKDLWRGATQTTMYFVSVLSGSDYAYLGTLNPKSGNVALTMKSPNVNGQPQYYQLWTAMYAVFHGEALPANYQLLHEGQCGRCGRALTVPESIATGLGPECAKLIAAGA